MVLCEKFMKQSRSPTAFTVFVWIRMHVFSFHFSYTHRFLPLISLSHRLRYNVRYIVCLYVIMDWSNSHSCKHTDTDSLKLPHTSDAFVLFLLPFVNFLPDINVCACMSLTMTSSSQVSPHVTRISASHILHIYIRTVQCTLYIQVHLDGTEW